ncbi:MAG: peptidoglycan bridge formation glycyltransferase FemA/FemB family protein [Deltaproteobacteria bacterium]|nr:peptidoglycan bridge formation glycyltransferase FemA/FemB family protein [Deltaproteobacteria bacterium]
MHIEVLDPHSEEEWDKYLLTNKYSGFLQSFCWGQLRRIAYGFKPVFLEVQEEGNPLAYFLFHEGFSYSRSNKIIYRLINPLQKSLTKKVSAIDGPVIIDDSKTEEILTSILGWLEKYARTNNIRGISLTPFRYHKYYADNLSIGKTFEDFGYSRKQWATYLVDLKQDEESLWNYVKRSARKSLKQVMKTNLVVKRTGNYEEYIEKFILPYRNMEKEFGREGTPLWFVEKIRDFDLKNKYYYYFYAEIDGRVVGVLGMYVYNGYATEIMSSTSKYAYENKIYAQDLLKWEMFRFARNLGCHTFDLASVNPNPQTDKERGIKQFKEKWGGEYREYFIYDLDLGESALFNTARRVYQIFKYPLGRLL